VETHDPYTHFFNETFGNFQEELDAAKEQGKKGIMLFFEMDECPFCHRMKKTVMNRSDVQAYFRERFLIFPVDIEGDLEVTDFQGNPTTQKEFAFKQFRVRATPVIAFFDLEGKLVQKFTGATANEQEFLWLGEFVAEGHFKEGNFSKYKRAKREQAAN
jgi:thioredoxin-related protein